VEQKGDSGENQIDGEQEHSEVFGDVHGLVLRQVRCICTLKGSCDAKYLASQVTRRTQKHPQITQIYADVEEQKINLCKSGSEGICGQKNLLRVLRVLRGKK
jgi:hypothetical protein